ncbi:MAG: hypothetical protein WAZ21_00645 [Candidatus Saccharimonadales bacterium]
MAKLKDFLYLDTSLVNSIFSQYYEGVITSMTKASSASEDLKATIGFDLKLVKGSTGGTSGSEFSRSETLDLHHYAYEMLETELKTDGVIGEESKDIILREGNLRVIDSLKTIETFDGLKAMISGYDAAMKLAVNPTQEQAIPQDVRSAAQKSKDIGKLVSQLYDNGIFAHIGNETITLDRKYLVSQGSPEFTNNGRLFEGRYVVVGLNSTIASVDPASKGEDMLLSLSRAFADLQDIVKISTIKPIAIYRVVKDEN